MGSLTGIGSVRLTCDAAAIAVSGANSMPLQPGAAFRVWVDFAAVDTVARERCTWTAIVQGFRNVAGDTVTIDGSTITKSAWGTGATATWAIAVTADSTTGTLNWTFTNGVGGQTVRVLGKQYQCEVL